MNRKLPKDLLGNEVNYKQENQNKRNYQQSKKDWNFPFKHAFERAGIKSHD